MLPAGLLLLTFLAQTELPYRRTVVPREESLCLAWNNRQFTYNVQAAGSSQTPGETEFDAIDASFQSWQALSNICSDFQFIKGPRLPNVLVGKVPGSENNNVVVFRETKCIDVVPANDTCFNDDSCSNKHNCWDYDDNVIGLTTTTFSFRTGTIFDADIELNASPHFDGTSFLFTTVGSPVCSPENVNTSCVATDVQNTLTHEIGHALGFDHVEIFGSTVEASAPIGDTKKRIIDSGTSQGFCSTYPRGQPPTLCDDVGQLRRKVVARNTGTAGLEAIGCAAATGGASLALIVLTGWLRLRRRSW